MPILIENGDTEQPLVCTASEAEFAARQLDGETKTELVIRLSEEEFPYLILGGGKNGWCDCELFENASKHFVLQSNRSHGGAIEMVVGGQRIRMNLCDLATIDDTLKAVQQFARTGTIDSSLNWQEW